MPNNNPKNLQQAKEETQGPTGRFSNLTSKTGLWASLLAATTLAAAYGGVQIGERQGAQDQQVRQMAERFQEEWEQTQHPLNMGREADSLAFVQNRHLEENMQEPLQEVVRWTRQKANLAPNDSLGEFSPQDLRNMSQEELDELVPGMPFETYIEFRDFISETQEGHIVAQFISKMRYELKENSSASFARSGAEGENFTEFDRKMMRERIQQLENINANLQELEVFLEAMLIKELKRIGFVEAILIEELNRTEELDRDIASTVRHKLTANLEMLDDVIEQARTQQAIMTEQLSREEQTPTQSQSSPVR